MPLIEFPLEFCNGIWAQKLEWCPY